MFKIKHSIKPHEIMLMGLVFALSISFALYTQHAWEDWYITYRASKNLAIGNGLVFSIGQKVHSFTSPLGTLIPALLNIVTFNSSDDLVLWLFRIFGCSLLSISAVLLLRIANVTGMAFVPTALFVGMFAVDVRIIDFSINGMETSMMMLFTVATLYLLTVPGRSTYLYLGAAWAGMMLTRPDSFIYIGAIALGYLLFNYKSENSESRKELFILLIKAALVTTVLYLPWFAWTWYYYGTPIPHTIVAKGLLRTKTGIKLITDFITFPYITLFKPSSIGHVFMPPYWEFGGWPKELLYFSKTLSLVCTWYWCIPFGRPQGRALSFALLFGHYYLTAVSANVSPWYVPTVSLLSIVVIGQIAQNAYDAIANVQSRFQQYFRLSVRVFTGICCIVLLQSLLVTIAAAYQLKIQQNVIELGNRKQIGMWLKNNASSPRDTVFLECLGYIGFYSQLKMLDFPGMSSPEVVGARRSLRSNDFATLIFTLHPDWLVLRPGEIEWISSKNPFLLTKYYEPVKLFDVSKQVTSYAFLPGRQYLEVDQTFVVYKAKTF